MKFVIKLTLTLIAVGYITVYIVNHMVAQAAGFLH
jgi:hypothetical protein